MKKMNFKKTVLAVALAMGSVCAMPVTQAANYLEKLQNVASGSVWQAAAAVYSNIMGDISKAIADGAIDITKNLDDLISMKTFITDIEINELQKSINNTKTAMNGGGVNAVQKEKMMVAIDKMTGDINRLKITGTEFVATINQNKAAIKDAAAKGAKAVGHLFDAYEIGKEFYKMGREILETKKVSLVTIRDLAVTIASISPLVGIPKYTLESANKVVAAGDDVMEEYRGALLNYSRILDRQRNHLREMVERGDSNEKIEEIIQEYAIQNDDIRGDLFKIIKNVDSLRYLGVIPVIGTQATLRLADAIISDIDTASSASGQQKYVKTLQATIEKHNAILAEFNNKEKSLAEEIAVLDSISNQDNFEGHEFAENPDSLPELAESDAEKAAQDASTQQAKEIALAIESLQKSNLGSNRWDGGMSARLTYCDSSHCETSVRHDSGSGTSMVGKWSKPGQIIDFYTDGISFDLAPQPLSARVKVDLSTAQSRVRNGKTYYYGDLDLDQQDLFGNGNKVTSARFDTNESMDFFRFNLGAWDYINFNDTRMDGYYGQRLEASKLPDKGVSSYDFGDGPYQIAYSGYQDGRMLVNWASNKVYGYNGRDFFIGKVNRQTSELTGRYIRDDDYLHPADAQYYPGRKRFVNAAPSLQLYGSDAPNGIGGTFDFGSIYSFGGPGGCTIDPASGKCDSPTLPIATGNVLVSSHLNQKDVKTKAEPQRTTVWHGFATAVATRFYDTGMNDFDQTLLASSLANDVRLTLRPDSGEMNGTLLTRAIGSGPTYGLAVKQDDSVYVNKNAFAAVNTDGDGLSYLATTPSQHNNDYYDYDYLSWGIWGTQLPVAADNSLTKVHDAYWIAGAPTLDMPKTGVAKYEGWAEGAGFDNNGSQLAIRGSSTITVDFHSKNIEGNLNLMQQTAFTSTPYAAAQINGSMNDNRFTGKLTNSLDPAIKGDIRGAFYGAGAAEVGGNWNITTSDSQAAGIFAGRKQP